MGMHVKGHDLLEKKIKKMKNSSLVFDKDFRKNTRTSVRHLIKTTPKMTGITAKGWSLPQKLGLSRYFVSNNERTQDRKHSVVNILNYGRGDVFPKKSKRLYIPLTNKGRSKPLGAKIPNGLVYGVDYVFSKKARAFKGTGFMTDELKEASKRITKSMIKTIRAVHS